MLRVSKYVNLSLYIAVFFFFVCFFLVHRSFLSPFCFSVGKNKKKREILDECEGEFCIELSPSVLCINRTVLYIKWMQVAGSIQSFQNRVPCFFGGGVYVKKCFCSWRLDFTSCFVFIHENIIFAQCLFVNVDLFLYVCVWDCESVWGCVCVITGECVCVHACAHLLSWCLFCLCSHFLFGGGGDKNIVVALSQFVATYNLLYFFSFRFAKLSPNMTFFSLVVSLCIIQSKCLI